MLRFLTSVCLALLTLGCASTKRADAEYSKWTQPYVTRPMATRWFGDPPLPLRLVVTTIEGEVDSAALTNMTPLQIMEQQARIATHGFALCSNGVVQSFSSDFMGSKGGGGKLSVADMKHLETLLPKLPSDRRRLPAPGARLVVRTAEHGRWRVRVYNGRNAPQEVRELLQFMAERGF